MNKEEKEAIESLRKNRGVSFAQADIILNLIEKQQKEIEELKKCYVIKPKELEKEINKEWQDKIREKMKEIGHYKKLANECIEERIIIADSDSLNYGRKEAHEKDIEMLKELLEE